MATLLNRATLDGADLRGTDLSGCLGLTAEQLQGAIVDHRTRLPRELQYLLPTHLPIPLPRIIKLLRGRQARM